MSYMLSILSYWDLFFSKNEKSDGQGVIHQRALLVVISAADRGSLVALVQFAVFNDVNTERLNVPVLASDRHLLFPSPHFLQEPFAGFRGVGI